MTKKKTALVCGASGFIGGHLVERLKSDGYWVRGVDIKPLPNYGQTPPDEFIQGDLTDHNFVSVVMWGPNQSQLGQPGYFDEVYQLAADMGGAGYVFTGEHDANIMKNSALINLNVADIAVKNGVGKLFYSSSACIYPGHIQEQPNHPGLKETDAYPANPDSEYGWEKLFSERLYLSYARNFGLNVRIARFHNIYGPMGTWKGGKEKAPAAMIRKVLEAEEEDYFNDYADRWTYAKFIKVWGTGEQTRSFLYIDDCIDAVMLLMQSDYNEPINIGSEESITINGLAEMAITIHDDPESSFLIKNIDGPVGVNGRNSDNTQLRNELDWEPKVCLFDGMEKTYFWIKTQYDADTI
jgi:nucleoside-diphosphate-sugar epimerase